MTQFDCMCCCNTLPISKSIICPNTVCAYTVCITCQKTTISLSNSCMSCKMIFTNKFLIEKLGKTFVNGPLRKFYEEPLFEREKALLIETQPLVDWERIRRIEMAKLRFRKTPQIPPKPLIGDENKDTIDAMRIIFPCPKNMCRGFVISGKCGVCINDVCVYCRELKTDNHICDKNAVETIKTINTECKSCPQCTTMIYRIQGCDHMFCTACHSHFDWESGRILKASSNHHYNNVVLFSTNIIRRELNPDECTHYDLLQDLIPLDIFENTIKDNEIISILYSDVAVIRKTKNTKYNERIIVSSANNSLITDRVKYMLCELTEIKWKSHIYLIENHKKLDLHIAEVLNIYLTTMCDFQSYTLENPTKIDTIKSELFRFLCMINDSFISLQSEYGGSLIKIRTDFNNPDLPAIII